MAYSTELAAALTGATVGQLTRWRQPTRNERAALMPEAGKVDGTWYYSFRDLIALRTFVYLRETTSMQMIRRSVSYLEELDNREHLSTYRLVQEQNSAGRTIDLQWLQDDRSLLSLSGRPGQFVMQLTPMLHIVQAFRITRAGQDREAPDLYNPYKDVAIDPEVRGGYPVIEGSRVPFDDVASLLADGFPAAKVTQIYPSITPGAAESAYKWWRSMEPQQAA